MLSEIPRSCNLVDILHLVFNFLLELNFKNSVTKNPDPLIFRHGFRERIFIFSALVCVCTTVFMSCRSYLDGAVCLNVMLVHSSTCYQVILLITHFAVHVLILFKNIWGSSYKIITFKNPAVLRPRDCRFFKGQLYRNEICNLKIFFKTTEQKKMHNLFFYST